jgi:hypothetical protein
MTDKIDAIVARTMALTLEQLESNQIGWGAARDGVHKIHDDLVLDAPNHPALVKLRAFIADLDEAHGKR